MSVIIPLTNDAPYFDLQVQLDDVTYTLLFRWNKRESAWYMSIRDDIGTTNIIDGIKLVVRTAFVDYGADRQPPGIFGLLDTSGADLDPAIDELGTRCLLIYFTAADLGL